VLHEPRLKLNKIILAAYRLK